MRIFAALLTLTFLVGCQSMPESVKNDGQVAADRAKQKAEAAYRDLEKDMK
jgi:uncharacterized protein YcfL